MYTLDQDGSNERLLPPPSGAAMGLAWSPDGTQVGVLSDKANLATDSSKVRVMQDAVNGTYTDVEMPGRPFARNGFDWRGDTWELGYTRQLSGLDPVQFLIATGAAGSTPTNNLITPVTINGLSSPVVYAVRIHPGGDIAWSGRRTQVPDSGIYVGSSTLKINTGTTLDFAFSPKGDAVAAIRTNYNPITQVTAYFLDIVDWSGPYVRTLYSTSLQGTTGLAMCSVDWSGSQPAPIASITYRGTGSANEFNFDGSGSSATAGAQITAYAWDFGDGTTAATPVAVHQFATPGEHVVSLKVTDSNGQQATATTTLVARLTISTVTVTPTSPGVGTTFSISVVVRNDGGVPITGVTPSLTLLPATLATLASGPLPSSADLAGGAQATFTFTANATSSGTDTLVVTATGSGPGGTVSAPAQRRDVDITGAGIEVVLSVSPAQPEIGENFVLTATLTNKGATKLVNVSAILATDSSDIDVSPPNPISISALQPGAASSVTWTLNKASSGTLTARVDATGMEDNGTATERTGSSSITIAVLDRRLIVTTNGDQALSQAQVDTRICDVDSVTTGNQCTLRAAIQVANALGGTQSIGFAIPGSGVPNIAPGSELPPIRAAVTIDGTTQTGGWVELSGGSAGDANGLIVDLGPSLVRGLVINRWKKAGVLLRSGRGNVVAGNRIGSNPAGTQRQPNLFGVKVTTTEVRIGGTARTSGSACTGDCNLISGNERNGIWMSSRSGGSIEGNWIGADITGETTLPNGQIFDSWPDTEWGLFGFWYPEDSSGGGIRVAAESSNATQPGSVIIGGKVSSPGLAPGNLISGNFNFSVSIESGEGHVVAGNLIGLDKSGSRKIRPGEGAGPNSVPHYHVGIAMASGQPTKPSAGVSATIGGTSGMGNIISGFELSGVFIDPVIGWSLTVQGNRIGTNLTGDRAIPSRVGIAEVDQTDADDTSRALFALIRDNVVSGNERGIIGGRNIAGNFIGTDATGTRAVPNGVGISGAVSVGGMRPGGSTTCVYPCNLISGNQSAAIEVADSVLGNFIGTDLTGKLAIPNVVSFAGPVDMPAAILYVRQLGGNSGASIGVCDLACNLISGNADAAVTVGRDDGGNPENAARVQGNFLGSTIDGGRLANAGPAVRVALKDHARIGGDGNLGNLIADNTGPAVLVSARAKGGPLVQGNSIHGNGGGIFYAPDFTA
ncbi:MAG TPA: PKD domain-containing protein, partial [Gemmatimonadaceae bacterium]|nr:PKD domain-containing protein [Gemmatimonadaceae bacterium]